MGAEQSKQTPGADPVNHKLLNAMSNKDKKNLIHDPVIRYKKLYKEHQNIDNINVSKLNTIVQSQTFSQELAESKKCTTYFNQHTGECWLDSISQVFLFADEFKEQSQQLLLNYYKENN